MSKNPTIAASIGFKLVRKFSFLAALMLSMTLYGNAAYAVPCPAGGPNVSCDITFQSNPDTNGNYSIYTTTYDPNGDWTRMEDVYNNSGTSQGQTYSSGTAANPPPTPPSTGTSGTTGNGNPGTGGGGSTGAATASPSLLGVAAVICDVALILILDVGRGIATLSIIGVGIAAMFGKATWTQAVTVAVGVGIIFGALPMVTLLTLNLSSVSMANLGCIAVLAQQAVGFFGNLR